MARYDRLANLPLPSREAAFEGWPALRDLAGRERDVDLARRLRLHFLTLRVLHRRMRCNDADRNSLTAQTGRLADEFAALPARDPQRAALTQFAACLAEADVEQVVAEALDLAARALDWRHRAAAGEYAHCALELARRHGMPGLEVRALRVLARVAAYGEHHADARSFAQRATALALQIGDRREWAHAMVDASLAAGADHGARHATEVLHEIAARAREWDDETVGAIAGTALCEHASQNGEWSDALRYAWHALPAAESLDTRKALLEHAALALARLGAHDAADHAYDLLQQHASGAERMRLLAARARLQAESGNTARYREIADRIGNGALAPGARLELARAALAAGDHASARQHATAAASAARSRLDTALSSACADLLAQLDKIDGRVIAIAQPAARLDGNASRIAARVLALGESLAP